jgi:hypothetical protein
MGSAIMVRIYVYMMFFFFLPTKKIKKKTLQTLNLYLCQTVLQPTNQGALIIIKPGRSLLENKEARSNRQFSRSSEVSSSP